MDGLRKLRGLIFTAGFLFLLWLVLSGCKGEESTLQYPLLPVSAVPDQNPVIVPTNLIATLKVVALPMVQTAPEESLPQDIARPLPQTVIPENPSAGASSDQPKPQITLLFTGVIVPARCVQSAIDARGDANYIYDEVRGFISSADLAVGTLNASLSDLSSHTGCIETYVLVGDSRSAEAASSAGFDVMSVATNHIKNCSGESCKDYFNRAFNDTLDNLRAAGIVPVGAGANLEDAIQPVVVEVQGIRFGFVSLGMIEPAAFAGPESPGIAELNDENLRSAIDAARLSSDVVIAMPHWGPEDSSAPDSNQVHFARVAVEAGADVVVGNHTHVVQAIQQLDGIDVFYGLGNFVFDQTWDLAHQQGVILLLHFNGTDYTGYELIPTHVDGDGTVHIANQDEAAQINQRITEASESLRQD